MERLLLGLAVAGDWKKTDQRMDWRSTPGVEEAEYKSGFRKCGTEDEVVVEVKSERRKRQ